MKFITHSGALPSPHIRRAIISQYCPMAVLMALVFFNLHAFNLAVLGQAPAASSNQDADPKTELQYKVIWNSETGSYTYSPEKWGELRVRLQNSRSEPREILCSTYFDQDSSLQFGRRLWIPANSALKISHPLLLPKCDPKDGRNLKLHSLVLDVSTPNEVMIKNESGQLVHDAALLVTHGGRNTAIIGTPPQDTTDSYEVSDLIVAGRVGQKLNNKVTVFTDPFLPAAENLLDPFDHLVIADDRIIHDVAALAAVRAWVHAGGHLWVMMDRVTPAVLRRLIGDEFDGQVIDRVGLTTVRVDKAPVLSDTNVTVGESIDYDKPVDLVRMVISNVDVQFYVDGWPAAMTRPCGDGKLLITTLGLQGWMRRNPEQPAKPDDPQMVSHFTTTEPMREIANDFFQLRKPELLPLSIIEPHVRDYIGYAVPSWGSIVGTILGFSLCIVLLGIWLNRTGHLEHVSWLGSLLAIIISAFLLMIGRTSRHSIPATIASVEFVQAIGGTDALRSRGLISAYHPEGSTFAIGGTEGGLLMPDMTGAEAIARRMVTTDLGAFHWENLPQPAGLRSTSFTQSQQFDDRLTARATFDSEGVKGLYHGEVPAGSDAIIATRMGRMGLELKADGQFRGGSEMVFQRDQYVMASLLSDEQNRRRHSLERLFSNPKRTDYPNRPQLMFWTEPVDHGFQFGEHMAKRGTALMALPLIIDRPANNTEMLIPSPFLSYFNRRNPDGSLPSTMWDASRKEWQERSTPGLSWLSFMIPRELLPLTPLRARLDISVTGPVGRIEILGMKDGNVTSLKTVTDPVGSFSIDLADAEAFPVDSQGRLALGISAGDASRPQLTHNASQAQADESQIRAPTQIDQNAKVNYWRIESLALQLWAKTTQPTAKN